MPDGMTFKENLEREIKTFKPGPAVPLKQPCAPQVIDWPKACAEAARIFDDAAIMAEAEGDLGMAAYFRDLAAIKRRDAARVRVR